MISSFFDGGSFFIAAKLFYLDESTVAIVSLIRIWKRWELEKLLMMSMPFAAVIKVSDRVDTEEWFSHQVI